MSYKYYMKRQNPISAWVLDDTLPFHDASGFGAFGDKLSASSPLTDTPLVAGAINGKVFTSTRTGKFACNVFKPGLESRPFVLEAWIYPILKTTTGPQQIFSHDTGFDGLSINGTVVRFSTIYQASGEAYCEYDLQQYRAAHIVGMHFEEYNQLWVDGELVASVALTEEQLADSYLITDKDFLYCGYTTSSQNLSLNGLAIYSSLTGEQIKQNYLAGRNVMDKQTVSQRFGGIDMGLSLDNADTFLDYTFNRRGDYQEGLNSNVQFTDDSIVPVQFTGLPSEAGYWVGSVPLDHTGATSIYGVYVEWEGTGITVDHSINGTTWWPCTNRRKISVVPVGYNPAGKDLEFRVNFAGGVVDDTAHLDNLRIVGIKTNTLRNPTLRSVTYTDPAVPRYSRDIMEYRDDAGLWVGGGDFVIGSDPTADVEDRLRTLELWVNMRSGTITPSVGGSTAYVNAVLGGGILTGDWCLMHFVWSSTVTGTLTLPAVNGRIGRAVIYPDELTQTDIDAIYRSYTGRPVISIVDAGAVAISELLTPLNVYDRDWSITAAG
jgi:hypothetical protein